MKKSILFLACASLLTGSAAAQDVADLFAKGKAAIERFDKMEVEATIAKQKTGEDATAKERANLFMEGVEMLNKALPLDTIIEVDKKTGEPKIDKKTGKPKFKTKYSNDIQEILVNHISGLGTSGDIFFQGEEFEKAYQAYGAYAKALLSEQAKAKGYQVTEKDLGNILFMQSYAAYQTKKYEDGYSLAKKAMDLGFDQYGVGDIKNACVANIVQNYVNDKNFAAANAYADKVLAIEPNGFNYDIKGFVVEQEKGINEAAELFKKSMELGFGNGVFDYGRFLFTKAQNFIDANPNKTNKELAPELVPMLKEAAQVLEQAKELAPDTSAASILDQINYQLEVLEAK